MALNPFLSMGGPAPAAPQSHELNPFMMDAAEAEEGPFLADNPFATAGANPFSDFGGFEETTSCIPRPTKPTELPLPPRPPPPRPLPPDTQSLLQSVTGHLELTSSHLLGRIPPTRSPSPVSARDLVTPSPPPIPPARPPRPAPPARPTEEVDLFSAPAPPPASKPSTAQILSLYAQPAPAEPEPPDFLSADLPPAAAPAPAPPAELASAADVFAAAETPDALPARPAPAPMDWSDPGVISDPQSLVTSPFAAMSASPPAVLAAAAGNPFADFAEEPAAEADTISHLAENAVDVFGSHTLNVFEAPPTDTFNTANTDIFSSTPMDAFETAPADSELEPTPGNVFVAPTSDTISNVDAVTPPGGNTMVAHEADTFGVSDSPFGATDAVFSSSHGAFGATNDAFAASDGGLFAATANAGTDIFASPHDGFEPMQTEPCEASTVDTSWDAVPAAVDAGWDTTPAVVDASWDTATAVADAGWDTAPHDDTFPESQDAFDAFSAKFDSTSANLVATGAWGAEGESSAGAGFEAEGEGFDEFLSLSAPPATPRLPRQPSTDSDTDNFSLFIRPAAEAETAGGPPPAPLAPPPRPHALPVPDSARDNPFHTSADVTRAPPSEGEGEMESRSGGETPPTPLFDEDTSQPLEDFPRTKYQGAGWEMHLRQPNKKKITGQRFWKKIFVRLTLQGDNPVVQLFNSATDKEPFQELPLQACYSVSEVGAQQFDQFGKIFTVKLQYIFYKERPGVRPGQVTKAERITNKLSQFAAYAIQGDYQGVKEFGSDLRKLGLPVEHAPQVSQLFKIGSLVHEDVLQFSCCIEEALFRLPAHRDRALTYKMEEVQITAVDELYVEQDAEGSVLKQIARVRLFFLGFLSGMPDVELGVNDLRRQGKEVVGRHDIIPVVTEEWIRVEDTEFHACVQPEDFANTQIIKFKPPDACYIELMRFRVRPPKNRELPLQLKATWLVLGSKVELRADVLVPGFASRKLGQVPCEDVSIRFPIPESWIYLFRVEKHFRYGSVKSAHRRTGKIKGIERFLGAVDTLQESLIEVTSGQAKYEHQHRAIVWRMPRLPKEGQGAYTTHNLVCRMALTAAEQVPSQLAPHAHVAFTMPATQVSHTTVRSVSLQNYDSDPPEKYVRYLARHEYLVGIERTSRQDAPAYALVTKTQPSPCAAPAPPAAALPPQPPSSDSDSD